MGWNFLFTGSTTLSLSAYAPEEKDRAQGALNFCVFATLALTSFASGVLVTTQGWQWLNLGSLVPLLLTAAALLWLARSRRVLRLLAQQSDGALGQPLPQRVEHRRRLQLVEDLVVQALEAVGARRARPAPRPRRRGCRPA